MMSRRAVIRWLILSGIVATSVFVGSQMGRLGHDSIARPQAKLKSLHASKSEEPSPHVPVHGGVFQGNVSIFKGDPDTKPGAVHMVVNAASAVRAVFGWQSSLSNAADESEKGRAIGGLSTTSLGPAAASSNDVTILVKMPPLPPLAPYAWLAGERRVAAETVKAEDVESALALAAKAEAPSGRCSGTVGGWCEAFMSQSAALARPASGLKESPPKATVTCPGDCNGEGVCDLELGQCRCVAGFTGPACTERVVRRCAWAGGGHPAARCPGPCDFRRAHCYCPRSTPFGGLGGRQMGISCVPNRYALFDDESNYTVHTEEMWAGRQPTIAARGANVPGVMSPEVLFGDPAIHPEIAQPGWCVAKSGGAPPATSCPCILDGRAGHLCDEVVRMLCPADCSDRGRCDHGFCFCDKGWFGTDCSRAAAPIDVSALIPPTPPGEAAVDNNAGSVVRLVALNYGRALPLRAADTAAAQASVSVPGDLLPAESAGWPARRRPFIYVYDVPVKYTVEILQFRMDAGTCNHRRFTEGNATKWRRGPGYQDIELHEALLVSPHRTMDPYAADFFYVPLYLTCYIWPVANFASFPRHREDIGVVNREHAPIELVIGAKRWVEANYPFWTRSNGADHIFYFGHDEGACWSPEEIKDAIMITHWGRMDDFGGGRPISSSAFPADNYDNNPLTRDLIGSKPCFKSEKDICIPVFTFLEGAKSRRDANKPRTVLFSFQGESGSGRSCDMKGAPDRCYSRGIRQKVAALFKGRPGFRINENAHYGDMLAASQYCLVAPGDGFSTRLEDSVLHGCVPVLIQDNVLSPWGNVLDLTSFTVRVAQADIEQLEAILTAIPAEGYRAKQQRVMEVAPMFEWSGFYRWPLAGPGDGRLDALGTLMGALYQKAAQKAAQLKKK